MSRPIEPFIALSTGGKFYPLGPDPDRIDVRDIAHSLSQQCRYAGHTSAFWSVAAHSLEVSRRVERRYCGPFGYDPNTGPPLGRRIVALAALLHDASEAYLQDVVRPIKPLVHGYYQWEANVERAIAQKYGLPHPWPDLVKAVDDEIVRDEVASFFPPGSAAWDRYGLASRDGCGVLIALDPKEAEERFLKRFYELTDTPVKEVA